MPKIEIRSGKAAGKSVELKGSTITLGNRRNATVELKDAWVSFNHAQITCEGDRFFIADHHSKAGTFLNDRRIDRTPVAMAPGDRILLGKTEIVFVADGAAAASAAPAGAASAPAAVFVPAAPAAAAAPVSLPADLAKIESLERDLRQATGDLKDLREHVIAREKELSEVNEKVREILAKPIGDSDEVARWKKAVEDLKATARQRLEEVGRYVKQLEGRLLQAGGGGGDAHLLVEKEREIARLRDEMARVQEETQKRIFDAAEKLQKEAGNSAELEDERKRADDAAREAGILRSRVEDLEDEKKKLGGELKSIRSEIKAYEQALEDRNKDVERLEAIAAGQGPAKKGAAAPPADSGATDELRAALEAEKKRTRELEATLVELRAQVEEINQDMLEQEDELREEISTLEKKLAEAQERSS
jgi:predicted  nucleic acid-binding Zn-ribbon protein